MNYEFSISKTGIVSISVGSIVISILLFAAGLLVGSQWLISSSASAASTTARNEQPELPQEPVLKDEPKAARPKTAPAPPAKETDAKAPEATAQAAIPPLTDDQIEIIEEAASDPANSENAAAEPEYVTVQVGVFLDENEANRLLKQIERKGYAPSFFSGRDAEAREWHAVRIGAYSDKQQAANAAANFTKQEKMKAVVRPLGSL